MGGDDPQMTEMRTTTNNTSTSQPISMKNTTRFVNGPCRAGLLPGGAAASGAEAAEVASCRGLPSSLIVPFWHSTPRPEDEGTKRPTTAGWTGTGYRPGPPNGPGRLDVTNQAPAVLNSQ